MKKKLIFLGILIGIIFFPSSTFALNQVNIYFFHWNECGHCIKEEEFLKKIESVYSNVKVYRYETTEGNNRELMKNAKSIYEISGTGVPFTVIGDQSFYGFSDSKMVTMENAIIKYSSETYENKLQNILNTPYKTNVEGVLPERITTEKKPVEPTPSVTETPSPSETPKEDKNNNKNSNNFIFIIGMSVVGIILVLGIIISFIEYRNKKLEK